MTHRLRVLVSGRVQGVGYRWSAAEQARRLGLNGWVRNLPDGRVEAEFEGAEDLLSAMRDWCAAGPRLARVDLVAETWDHGVEPRHAGVTIRG